MRKYNIIIPISDRNLATIMLSFIEQGKYYNANKYLNLRKTKEEPMSEELIEIEKTMNVCKELSIARYDFKTLLKPKYVWLPMLRNLLVPAIFTGLALLFRIPAELASIAITFSALPVASLLATFTVQYDPNQEAQFEAAATVLFSTVFTVFTIPLWAAVLSRIY